ncbi:hypothetical protein [Salegentibacter salinarum]|uniref:hypothetical protein n=1 Tax=Salegentibacter salinarum TaxID=447422 RepID=UPI0013562F58|nr:hypothetical protein [Salegentibacter salinarum]
MLEKSDYYNNCTCKLLNAEISNLKGRIFIGLGYHSFALENLNEGIEHLKSDTTQSSMIGKLYLNKAAAYSGMGEIDSLFFSQKRALKYSPITMNYVLMGRWYLTYDKKIDSAKYFLEIAQNKLDESVSRYQESIYLRNVAYYNKVIGDFEEALCYYNKALDISLEINRNKEVLKTYRNLAGIYSDIGDAEKSNSYYNKFLTLSDSVTNSKNKIRDIAARKFIHQQEETYNKKKYQWLTISLCAGIFLVGGSVLSRKYIRSKYKKSVKENNDKLQEINSLVNQKKLEEVELKAKSENNLRELCELAKRNDESFLPEFRKHYPNLSNKIQVLNPKITKSDFILLALIWLNFSSKDIARYTFVQHKTVQIKKYRLRKKLDLSKGTDLYQWLQDLNQK